MMLFFDDASVTAKAQSAFVRVFYSLVGTGSAREMKIVVALAHKLGQESDNTWIPILDSFEKLAKPVDADGCEVVSVAPRGPDLRSSLIS